MSGLIGGSGVMGGFSAGAVNDGFLSDAGVAPSGAERCCWCAVRRDAAVDGAADERLGSEGVAGCDGTAEWFGALRFTTR